jgi:NAD(P)-dependent dehydrogenase (short-subunit alcohol dehydrogenase family)
MTLDVGDLSSVREFAAAFKAKYDRLDILLNNAGLMAIPRQETADGFEMQLGVNHLGHFALTGLLLDLIVKTPNARIHNVSSTAGLTGSINFDDLNSEKSYGRWAAYCQSKLANVFFAFELHKRLQAAGHDTMVNVSHPGLVYGHLQSNSMQQSGTGGIEGIFYSIARPLLARDISKGVQPMLYAMTSPQAEGGKLYGPRIIHHHGGPGVVGHNKAANDADALKRFWEASEELTGIRYAIPDKAGV